MGKSIQALRIRNLETRLSLRRFVCASLELEIESAPSHPARLVLVNKWVEATNGCEVLELALEILKREEGTFSWNQASAA